MVSKGQLRGVQGVVRGFRLPIGSILSSFLWFMNVLESYKVVNPKKELRTVVYIQDPIIRFSHKGTANGAYG